MTIYLSLLKSVVGPAALSEGQDVGLVHLLPTPLDLKGQRRSPPRKAMSVHFQIES